MSEHKTKGYVMVWANKAAKTRTVTLYLGGGGHSSNMELTPEDALQLARDLMDATADLPRVASAADLGLEAA